MCASNIHMAAQSFWPQLRVIVKPALCNCFYKTGGKDDFYHCNIYVEYIFQICLVL